MKDKRLATAELYDSIVYKSKIYRIGDKPFFDLVKKFVKKGMTVYEPGCGTGLITKEIAKIKGVNIIASDPSSALLIGAKKRLSKFNNVKLVRKSAIGFRIEPADVIVMRYVYHHILDNEKQRFVKTMFSNLKKKGKMLILDEFIPYYSSKKEWKKSLTNYHDKKTEIALKLKDKLTADCEQESKKLGLAKVDEYKVHLKLFEKQLKNAGFIKIRKFLVKHPKLKDSKPLGMYIIIAER
ncbi:class I SAM-dependent methyltransferase [Candidatus Woesearchaeota archaeon]|nr:class I SAM-dependent methyltransferase [Candidatus Woesearchaeota archaeon]